MTRIGSPGRWHAALGALVALVLLGGVLASGAAGQPTCTDTFTGPSGGDWTVAANWSAGVPTSSTVACWASGTTVVVGAGDAVADSIQGGNLQIEVRRLQLAGPDESTVGNFTMSSGALNGPGTLAVIGNFAVSGGQIAEQGGAVSINQTGGGSFTISESAERVILYGTTITTTSPVNITSKRLIGESRFGLPSITTTGSVTFAPGEYEHAGAPLTIAAKGFKTTGATSVPQYVLHMTGSASSLEGSLGSYGLETDAKTIVSIPTGLTLSAATGTISGSIAGHGTFAAIPGGAVVLAAGAHLESDSITLSSGAALVVEPESFYKTPASTAINGGRFYLRSTTAATGNFSMTSGAVYGPGSLAVTGSFALSGGQIAVEGGAVSINQTGGGSFTISESAERVILYGTTITTTSPANITSKKLVGESRYGVPSITTTSTATLTPGEYEHGNAPLTITTQGVKTTGSTTVPDYALHVTGSSSTLEGSLASYGIETDAKATVPVPAGVTLSTTTGTISGSITGHGAFAATPSGTVVLAAGGSLETDGATVSGALVLEPESTYRTSASTTINGGRFYLRVRTASTGNFSMSSGAVYGPGSLAVTGSFAVSGGEIAVEGGAVSINQTGGGSFSISGSGERVILFGVTITTTSPVSVSNKQLIADSRYGASSITTTSTATFGPGEYERAGAPITITSKGFETTGSTSVPQYVLHLTGSVSSLEGSLAAGGLETDARTTISIPTGVTLSSASGTISGSVTGHGTFAATPVGTVVLASGGSLTSDSATITGALVVEPEASYKTPTATTVTGGRFYLRIPTAATGSFSMSSGAIYGPGSLAVSGTFALSGGEIAVEGGAVSINQTGGGSFTISESAERVILLGATISTTSPVSVANRKLISESRYGASSITTTATVTLASGEYERAGASLTIAGKGFSIAGSTSAPEYALVQSGGSTEVSSGVTLTGASFALEGGTLLDAGTIAAPVALTGGLLEGAGSVGNLFNTSGTVAPGDPLGTLTVNGDYSQGSGAILQISVEGVASGQFSILNVTGNITVDGTLELKPTSGFASTAAEGETIDFLPFVGSRSGTFAATTVSPPLRAGEPFTPEYEAAHVVDASVGAPRAPVNTSPPVVSGTPAEGRTLSTTNGVWANEPSGYSYRWQDCDSQGNSCTFISGAEAQSYKLTGGDVGHTIRAVVTATNLDGSTAASSEHTAVVSAAATPIYESCAKVSGGSYSDKLCTTQAAAGAGKYSLSSWATIKKKALSEKSKEAVLYRYTTGSAITGQVTCKTTKGKGTITGASTSTLTLEFGACSDQQKSCTSSAAKAGTIVSRPLTGHLRYLDEPQTKVGEELSPTTGTTFLAFTCEGVEETVRGGVIGEVSGDVNSISKTSTITFAVTPSGEPAYSGFEGAADEVTLVSTLTPPGNSLSTGLKLTAALKMPKESGVFTH